MLLKRIFCIRRRHKKQVYAHALMRFFQEKYGPKLHLDLWLLKPSARQSLPGSDGPRRESISGQRFRPTAVDALRSSSRRSLTGADAPRRESISRQRFRPTPIDPLRLSSRQVLSGATDTPRRESFSRQRLRPSPVDPLKHSSRQSRLSRQSLPTTEGTNYESVSMQRYRPKQDQLQSSQEKHQLRRNSEKLSCT